LRNKFPEYPVSGEKNPAPVVIGAVFSCGGGGSSGGVRLTGGGRTGKISSISGIDPSLNRNQQIRSKVEGDRQQT
jgi:hypothetical protein